LSPSSVLPGFGQNFGEVSREIRGMSALPVTDRGDIHVRSVKPCHRQRTIEVGPVCESRETRAAAAYLSDEAAAVCTVRGSKAIVEMPLNDCN